jgi:hypothetical protein
MQGMSSTLAISLAERLPTTASDRYAESIAHIQIDARLVAIYAPILSRLCLAEVESQTSALDVTPLLDAWPAIMLEFDRWKLVVKGANSKPLHILSWLTDRVAQLRS